MEKYLTSSPIDVAALLEEARAGDGAVCLFVGVVRNESGGRETVAIDYQAYGAMAESELARIANGLSRDWPGVRVRIRHRIGRLEVGEASVAVLATAPHRDDAFAACRATESKRPCRSGRRRSVPTAPVSGWMRRSDTIFEETRNQEAP